MKYLIDSDEMIQYAIRQAGKPAIYVDLRDRLPRKIRKSLPSVYYDAGALTYWNSPAILLFDTDQERDEMFNLLSTVKDPYGADLYAVKYSANGELICEIYKDSPLYYFVNWLVKSVKQLPTENAFIRYRDNYAESEQLGYRNINHTVIVIDDNVWVFVIYANGVDIANEIPAIKEMINRG